MKFGIFTPLLLLLKFAVADPIPLVIWHGLGDKFDNDGLVSVGELYQDVYPDAFVHIIYVSPDPGQDRTATFFGKLDDQLETVCDQLAQIKELQNGFHAVGFSQGGLFLRAYIERCNKPAVHTLITFGSPHNGIAAFGNCKANDWLCRTAIGLLKANTWSDYVQSHVVPAQYFRNPSSLDDYLDYSGFLADINNERSGARNKAYVENLANMEGGLVLYLFEDDETVIPKESAWFADVIEEEGDDGPLRNITWLRDRKMYNDDWLGLKKLDEQGKIKFLKTPGRHMLIDDKLLRDAFEKHLPQPDGTEKVLPPKKKFGDRLLALQAPEVDQEMLAYDRDAYDDYL